MKIRTTATRKLEWDAAHRVMNHESKCATLHGHRYTAFITVEAERLDSVDRVVDFGVVKQVIGAWIDHNWDHTTILNAEDVQMREAFKLAHGRAPHRSVVIVGGEPTVENLSMILLELSQKMLDNYIGIIPSHAELTVTRVRIYETPNCYADAEPT